MKAVLLAGGLGTRLREETEFRPKPMVHIGDKPILWHIMKCLAHFGVNHFIVAAGYRADVIQDYFLNYGARSSDFTVELGKGGQVMFHNEHEESDWLVTVANTGLGTATAGRVREVLKYTNGERFIVAYGDGVANADVRSLEAFHIAHGRIATVTAVRPRSRFGQLQMTPEGIVDEFTEKPIMEGWVSAGYFMFEPEIADYLREDGPLEEAPLAKLVHDRELCAFRHEGFWQPMDTYREVSLLNEMWNTGKAPWKVWN